jgi:hypothetical protein
MKAKYKVALAMVTSFALGAVAVQSLHAQAKPSSDEEKIANAMTAAPPPVSRNSSVVEMNEDGSMKVLRKGSGEWTCVPDDPSTPGNDPMCLDPNAMECVARLCDQVSPARQDRVYLHASRRVGLQQHRPVRDQTRSRKSNDYRTTRNGRRTEDEISPRV